MDLQRIRRIAKRTRHNQLNKAEGIKRKRISKIQAKLPYRLDGNDNVLLIILGFGHNKLTVKIIAGNNQTGQIWYITYAEAVRRMTPVTKEELPLFVGLEHYDLLEELIKES